MQKTEYPTIHDIEIIEPRGPWTTKSGGRLSVLFMADQETMTGHYSKHDESELPETTDIRGIRLYTITDIPIGSVGGNEWHRVRREMIFSIVGSVRWTIEDTRGSKKRIVVPAGSGIWVPPFILHSYEVLENKSSLLVFANTLFDPHDTDTHDTYSREAFREL